MNSANLVQLSKLLADDQSKAEDFQCYLDALSEDGFGSGFVYLNYHDWDQVATDPGYRHGNAFDKIYNMFLVKSAELIRRFEHIFFWGCSLDEVLLTVKVANVGRHTCIHVVDVNQHSVIKVSESLRGFSREDELTLHTYHDDMMNTSLGSKYARSFHILKGGTSCNFASKNFFNFLRKNVNNHIYFDYFLMPSPDHNLVEIYSTGSVRALSIKNLNILFRKFGLRLDEERLRYDVVHDIEGKFLQCFYVLSNKERYHLGVSLRQIEVFRSYRRENELYKSYLQRMMLIKEYIECDGSACIYGEVL